MAIEIFPVVHVIDNIQAAEQSLAAFEAGADGVYLIDHHTSLNHTLLFDAYTEVAENAGDKYVGLNILQTSSGLESFLAVYHASTKGVIPRLPDGIWTDDALPFKEDLVKTRDTYPELAKIRYLGGTAFKYTDNYTGSPIIAAEHARKLARFVDVITTSGPGTGQPPSPLKIEAMKSVLDTQPLAIASGIDADNIHDFAGLFDQLLVSSSIETHPHSGIFDLAKLEDLVAAAHAETAVQVTDADYFSHEK